MSTFYAVFQDPAKARLAAMALLNQGVPTDDISLVARGSRAAFGKTGDYEDTSDQPMADATSFVGREDDPVIDNVAPEGPETEMRYAVVESPIGGGISTSTLDDDVPTVDESDESQWLSEDAQEPGETATQADRELRDLDLAVDTGFPTKASTYSLEQANSGLPVEDLERSLEIIDVPGFGMVMGTGSLATAALDYGDGDPSDDLAEMMKHFHEEGVPDDMAEDFLQALNSGKALFAIGLVPGEVEPQLVEAVADQFGAQKVATFDAPRY